MTAELERLLDAGEELLSRIALVEEAIRDRLPDIEIKHALAYLAEQADVMQREIDRKRTRAPRKTPWGDKQEEGQLLPGVVSLGTASHGGIWLDEKRRAQMPEYLKVHSIGGRGEWWEEDCQYAIPVVYFLSRKKKLTLGECMALDFAVTTAQEYFPSAYEKMIADRDGVPAHGGAS